MAAPREPVPASRLEVVEPPSLQHVPGALGLVAIDARDREADVDQHEVADAGVGLALEADLARDAAEAHLREAQPVVFVRASTTLAGDAEAHRALLRCRGADGGDRRLAERDAAVVGRDAAVDEHLEAVGVEQRERALGEAAFWKQPPVSATVSTARSARARAAAGGDGVAPGSRGSARRCARRRARRVERRAATARTIGRRSIDERRAPRRRTRRDSGSCVAGGGERLELDRGLAFVADLVAHAGAARRPRRTSGRRRWRGGARDVARTAARTARAAGARRCARAASSVDAGVDQRGERQPPRLADRGLAAGQRERPQVADAPEAARDRRRAARRPTASPSRPSRCRRRPRRSPGRCGRARRGRTRRARGGAARRSRGSAGARAPSASSVVGVEIVRDERRLDAERARAACRWSRRRARRSSGCVEVADVRREERARRRAPGRSC